MSIYICLISMVDIGFPKPSFFKKTWDYPSKLLAWDHPSFHIHPLFCGCHDSENSILFFVGDSVEDEDGSRNFREESCRISGWAR